jgi:hypothetical protein
MADVCAPFCGAQSFQLLAPKLVEKDRSRCPQGTEQLVGSIEVLPGVRTLNCVTKLRGTDAIRQRLVYRVPVPSALQSSFDGIVVAGKCDQRKLAIIACKDR